MRIESCCQVRTIIKSLCARCGLCERNILAKGATAVELRVTQKSLSRRDTKCFTKNHEDLFFFHNSFFHCALRACPPIFLAGTSREKNLSQRRQGRKVCFGSNFSFSFPCVRCGLRERNILSRLPPRVPWGRQRAADAVKRHLLLTANSPAMMSQVLYNLQYRGTHALSFTPTSHFFSTG